MRYAKMYASLMSEYGAATERLSTSILAKQHYIRDQTGTQ